jgi:hypothetical protein
MLGLACLQAGDETMLADNPFSALSFLAGPALLTNASTVLLLGTINRYARALDRARMLATRLGSQAAEMEAEDKTLLLRQLSVAQRRVLLIVRSLTAFYTAVGSFAFGTLAYLIGAALLTEAVEERIVSYVVLAATTLGVLCLVTGAATLAWESRLSYLILRDEAQLVLRRTAALHGTA